MLPYISGPNGFSKQNILIADTILAEPGL